MNNKEIKNTLNCIKLMVADFNDIHNNYDIDTQTELNYKAEIISAIRVFNETQRIWHVSLVNTKKGWCLKYV